MKTIIEFNGSEKQNKFAEDILSRANLTEEQIDNLLRYAGPTMYKQGIVDVTIIIENRWNLAAYADSLGRFCRLSADEKHAVAVEAVDAVRAHAHAKLKV